MRGPGKVVVMIAVVAATRGANAQQPDSASIAEQLFNQARELAKANRWVEACPKFEASLRYDPALGTRLNLATCYEHVDRLASAWGLYRESIDLAKKAGDIKRHDYAQSQAAALESRLAKLTIHGPDKQPPGLTVTRDGTRIDLGALGIALYVDAGSHEVAASAPGFEGFAQTVAVVDGREATVVIPALTAKARPEAVGGAAGGAVGGTAGGAVGGTAGGAVGGPAGGATGESGVRKAGVAGRVERRSESTEPAGAPSRTRMYIGLGVAGGGVVAAGVGLAFGVSARSTYRDATALCGPDLACSAADYPRGNQLVHDARSTAVVATALVIAGGAAIAGGAIVWLTAPRAPERGTAHLVPVVHDRGAGLAIAGGF